jgi:phosphatidylserine/phosphatidylglycerophosphate/cardiolipin synthase-like enzyme
MQEGKEQKTKPPHRETVITRSFNFTKAADEKNAQNLLIIRNKSLVEKYTKNSQDHAEHSESYVARVR